LLESEPIFETAILYVAKPLPQPHQAHWTGMKNFNLCSRGDCLQSSQRHKTTISLPPSTLDRSSRAVRADTMTMFRSKHIFYLALYSKAHSVALLRWLKAIDANGTKVLNKVALMYSKKKLVSYYRKIPKGEIAKLDVHVEGDGVVKLNRQK
jgi:hypothetical protein